MTSMQAFMMMMIVHITSMQACIATLQAYIRAMQARMTVLLHANAERKCWNCLVNLGKDAVWSGVCAVGVGSADAMITD